MAGLVPFNRNRSLKPVGFGNMLENFFTDPWFQMRNVYDTFKVDVQERDKDYYIEAEMPGIQKKDVTLELNEGRLAIGVNREEGTDDEKRNYIHRERHYSSLQRTIYLPDAKTEGITARMDNGVLSITVPKEEKMQNRRKIDIQ